MPRRGSVTAVITSVDGVRQERASHGMGRASTDSATVRHEWCPAAIE